ncbi:hypothetical protein BU16DRAFT_530223 [Lophium mytilinum]|uniref:Integral membrane protein n=1 Tax=Lophium mytilinum TaxID=390894 RepID=A0A6A6QIG6_9PEZI|nr:hypothetical protein BU16DRAFT_530223 [Lophium mytilinum]
MTPNNSSWQGGMSLWEFWWPELAISRKPFASLAVMISDFLLHIILLFFMAVQTAALTCKVMHLRDSGKWDWLKDGSSCPGLQVSYPDSAIVNIVTEDESKMLDDLTSFTKAMPRFISAPNSFTFFWYMIALCATYTAITVRSPKAVLAILLGNTITASVVWPLLFWSDNGVFWLVFFPWNVTLTMGMNMFLRSIAIAQMRKQKQAGPLNANEYDTEKGPKKGSFVEGVASMAESFQQIGASASRKVEFAAEASPRIRDQQQLARSHDILALKSANAEPDANESDSDRTGSDSDDFESGSDDDYTLTPMRRCGGVL